MLELLPSSTETERLVLGWLALGEPDSFALAAACLKPNDFTLERHQQIFSAMQELDSTGREIDRATVANELHRRGHLGSDGLSYLTSLDDGMPKLTHVNSYIEILRNLSLQRQIIFACRDLALKCTSGGETGREIIARGDRILSQLAESSEIKSDWETPGGVIQSHPGGLQGILEPTRAGGGIQTPWPLLNSTLCGLQPSELILLGGRPRMGKTALALQLAWHVAKSGIGVAYLSLEMSKASLVRRLISVAGRLDGHKMRNGWLTAEERKRAHVAAREISLLPLWIEDSGSSTAPALRLSLKRVMAQREIGMVIVDHFHLLQGMGREEERTKFNRIADDLQRYAKDFKVVFLVLAQLNRDCEKDKRSPVLSDLSETGKLEQNARVVMFIHREEVYRPEREDLRGRAELIVAKQSNGPTGKVSLVFLAGQQIFENLAYDVESAA